MEFSSCHNRRGALGFLGWLVCALGARLVCGGCVFEEKGRTSTSATRSKGRDQLCILITLPLFYLLKFHW